MRSPGSSRRDRSGSTSPRSTANGEGVYNRLRKWAIDGIWERCSPHWSQRTTPTKASTGPSQWTPPLCAHASMRPGPAKRAPSGEPADHAIGRSRGGPTTKIHLASVGNCRPLAFVVTAGQAGDAPAFAHVMARLRVARRRGRPRTRPDVVSADKAYSSRAIREHLRKRGSRAVIPVPADQRQAPRLRSRDIQAAQHRRTLHQPIEAVAGHSHPLREDRDHLLRGPNKGVGCVGG